MKKKFRRFIKDRSGATAIEYALICALVFLAIVTAVQTYTNNANKMYEKISNSMK